MRFLLRLLLVTVLLTLVRVGLDAVAVHRLPAASYTAWLMLADLIVAAILLALAGRSPWPRGRLAATLFVVAFLVGSAGTLTEAVLFRIVPLADSGRLTLSSALVSAVGALATARLALPADAAALPFPRVPLHRQVGRFVGCTLAYALCYFGAGIAVLPFVRAFYETIGLPSGGATIAMQLFVRGPMLVAVGILVTRMTPVSRGWGALLVAAVMAGLGGVAPLLVPSPFFPDAVRWVHMVEITGSNILFGTLVGWVYGRR